MKKEKECVTITSDDINEYETLDEFIDPLIEKMFKKYDKALVSGSMGTWQGRIEVSAILYDTDFSTFSEKLSDSIELIEVDIHDNHYDVRAIHHDGSNYYTIIPFSFNMLKSTYINELIKELDLREELEHYIINNTPYDSYVHKWYTCNKETKLEFLEDYEIENLPNFGNSDFLKRYKIEL